MLNHDDYRVFQFESKRPPPPSHKILVTGLKSTACLRLQHGQLYPGARQELSYPGVTFADNVSRSDRVHGVFFGYLPELQVKLSHTERRSPTRAWFALSLSTPAKYGTRNIKPKSTTSKLSGASCIVRFVGSP